MRGDMIETTECLITEQALASCSSSLIPAGKVVIATRVGLGKVCRVRQPTAINQDIRGLVPKNPNTLDDQYLFYCMKAKSQAIVAAGTGATVQGVRLDFIKGLEIPLPSLDEQRRIVKALDEVMEYTDSIIKGDEFKRSNIANLLNAIRVSEFQNLAELFGTVTIKDVSTRVMVGHVGSTSEHYRPDGVLFLRTQNIGEDEIDLSGAKFIDPAFHAKLKKSAIETGDVLIARVITDRVKCVVARDTLGEANCANVVMVRPGERLNSDYLAQYIQSPAAQTYLVGRRVGSAQSVVNTNVTANLPVPDAPFDVQRSVAQRLSEAQREFRQIESVSVRKRAALESLRSSMLDNFLAGRA